MIKNLSLVASGLLLSSSLMAADISTEASATSYSYTGDSGTYTTLTAAGAVEAKFTDEVSGKLSAFGGAILAGEIPVDGGVIDEFEDSAVLTEANVTYATDKFSVTAGRVAVDLEWAADYHEAVVASTSAIEGAAITAFYTTAMSSAPDVDGIADYVQDADAPDGAAGLDIKYTGIKDLELNAYGYGVTDVAIYAGLKATYNLGSASVMGHIAMSDESSGADAGTLFALEASTEVSSVGLSAGYIMAGEDNGIGSMGAIGDNYSPFDDGSNLGGADSSAVYVTASTAVAGVDLSALVGTISYGSSTDTEINLGADYSYNDNLSVGVFAAQVSGDYEDKYANVTVSYSF